MEVKDEPRPQLGRLLVRLFVPHRRGLVMTGAIALVSALLMMLIGRFASGVVRLRQDEEPITGLVVAWALIALTAATSAWLASWSAYVVGRKVVTPFTEHAFGHLLRQSLEQHGRRKAGATQTLMARLVQQVSSGLTVGISALLSSIAMAVGSLLAIAAIDWRWALASVPLGLLGWLSSTSISRRHMRALETQMAHERDLVALTEETQRPANFRLVSRAALAPHFERRFIDAHRPMHVVKARRRLVFSLYGLGLDLVLVLAPPLVWLVGVASGADIGAIVGIAVLLPQMMYQVLGLTYPQLQLAEIAPWIAEAFDLCEPGCPGRFDADDTPGPKPGPRPDSAATLVLDEVRVDRGGRRVLDGVSLVVEPGDRHALVGSNGAGKSTLLDAISELLELESGSVTLGGVPVHEIPRLDRRHRIAIVDPLPTLFTGSVRYNLTLLWPEAPEDAIRWACAAAGVDFDLDGPATELSTGQQMRVVIARALLLRPEILFFDESFAHLDPATLREILATIDRSLPDTAVVVISHQRDAELMRRVHVLAGGRIAQSGTYAELKAAPCGPFREYEQKATD